MKRQALVITGPTASGKSALALALSGRLGGEIVNADSMQVYRELRWLTARPSPEEEALRPHHLYGVAPGAARWSAGRFAEAALKALEQIADRGAVPILVGGTGLWLRAVTEGLSPMPLVGEADITASEKRLARLGLGAFRAAVVAADPGAGGLDPADRQRLLRADAVFRATGRPLSAWRQAPPVPPSGWDFRRLVLLPPRAALHARAADRLAAIWPEACREVEDLLTLGLDPGLPVMKAVGVPQIADWLSGRSSEVEAQGRTLVATRQLIKRQTTWAKGQFRDWVRAEEAVEAENLAMHLMAPEGQTDRE